MKVLAIFIVGAVLLGGAIAVVVTIHREHESAMPSGSQLALAAKPSHKKQLWHCGMHPQVIQDHPGDCPICHMALTPLGSGGNSTAGAIDIQIDPRVVQNMGVRTAEVTKGTLTKQIRTVGLMSLPEPGLHDVSLKVNGWIDKLFANEEGMHVAAGDPLFAVYSPEIQVASQELISARKSLAALGPGAGEAVKTEAQGLVDAAKRKLRLWDVSDEEIEAIAKSDAAPRDVIFRSPASGHVEEKMVVQGSSVQAGMKLLRISDHSKMWLELQVYSDAVPLVKVGQKVKATVEGVPGKVFEGEVTFILPHLDHMSRTLKVRATLDNAGFELRPGMFATAQIAADPMNDVILCPREAVIDTGTRQIAFIAEGNGHFAPRRVRPGQSGDNDMVQIVEGLMPGENVVTSGQFLMDVESRTIEATQKLAGESAQMMHDIPAASQPVVDGMPPTTAATRPTADVILAATQPVVRSQSLTRVYCPMVKADWLQNGQAIQNPYMGQKMSDCGEIRGKITAPPAGSPLDGFISSYLQVARNMNADKLDATALAALRAATEKLPAEKYAAIRDAATKLTDAKDVKTARAIFKDVSDRLIAALQQPGQ